VKGGREVILSWWNVVGRIVKAVKRTKRISWRSGAKPNANGHDALKKTT